MINVGDLVLVRNDLAAWYDEAIGVIVEIIGDRDQRTAVARVLLEDGALGVAYLRNCEKIEGTDKI